MTVSSSDETTAETAADDAVATRYGVVLADSLGQIVLHPSVDSYYEVAAVAQAEGFDQLIDLTAVDFLTYAGTRPLPEEITPQRFEVIAQLLNYSTRERIRLQVQVPVEEPAVASLFDLWPGSETLEREVFDMFGIDFVDHPDMCRVLMPDDWEGHPLRKDYGIGSIPVQFKAASNVR